MMITIFNFSYGQNQTSPLSIKVLNESNIPIEGAIIFLDSLGKSLGSTDATGSYIIKKTNKSHRIYISNVGYTTDSVDIDSTKRSIYIFTLHPLHNYLDTVLVKNINQIIKDKPLIGLTSLDMTKNKYIPVIFGEQDVLKSIQLLPGIKSAGDGNSGFYVRGGNTDQNLILYDEAPIYNASHLLGFFSTFNADIIQSLNVYKGDLPANYGGRLSSLVDIKSKDGDNTKTNYSGSIGLISSHINIDGPIKRNKSSFYLSARRTYVDALLKLSSDTSIRKNVLNFYDINAKLSFKVKKGNLSFSLYKGRDNLGLNNQFGLSWGNTLISGNYSHWQNYKLSSITTIYHTSYNYLINLDMDKTPTNPSDVQILSKISDFGFKHEKQLKFHKNQIFYVGLSSIYHRITPGSIYANQYANYNTLIQPKKYSLENNLWIADNITFGKYSVHLGLRASDFMILGPGIFYDYDNSGNLIDSSKHLHRSIVKNYWNLEPRFTFNYSITTNINIKLGYARNTQNIHLLNNTGVSTPTDIWLSSTNNIKPEIADQYSMGINITSTNKTYDFTSELYYKKLENQIDYKNGADLQINTYIESQLLYGKGKTYGWENILKKNNGKLTGWISYTYSRSMKKIMGINNDSYYPTFQDRPNELSIVAIYKSNNKWTYSSTFIYYTGPAVTYPSAKYTIDGIYVNYYSGRNQNRYPAYHRLDLSATYTPLTKRNYHSSWTFGIFNAYGRENTYKIDFIKDPNNPNKTIARQTALFRFIPTITYNFKF
ncbi:TonB-dependent receptor plug domain-containing protein [Rhizosphaericola mali]|nr:TonB-dependent receptor plug domain-containing protein [Rhizosphaericola mali]